MTTVFVSYAWESERHMAWVRRFAVALEAQGVGVRLDQLDLRPGSDLTKYMETAVRESDFVLLVCTPQFASRANERIGGVGYEQAIVTGEILSGLAHPEKFVPVLRGPEEESIPSFLRNRVWVDFRDDRAFDQRVAKLVEDMLEGGTDDNDGREGLTIAEDLQVYSEAEEFARSKEGLALSRTRAEEFAEECQGWVTLDGLRLLIDVFKFANQDMKLSRAEAEEFARAWMARAEIDEFDVYARLFEFATDWEGLNLRLYAAREFVAEFDEAHGMACVDRFVQAFGVARDAGKSRADSETFAFDQL